MQVQHNISHYNTMQLAEVIDNVDPLVRGRIRIKIHATQMECWAPMMAQSAGQDYGVSCFPKLGETVVIAFLSSDLPIVMGSLWSGDSSHTDKDGETDERYSITTQAGSVLEFTDNNSGASIEMKTASGQNLLMTEESSGKIEITSLGHSIKLSSSGIEIESSSEVTITAPQVKVSTGMLSVDAGMSRFSGVVQCSTLIATSVVSTTYSPGAGNIW
ncbi:MAG: VgrG protein [Gammaproteobacteria bacterium]|nr:VgrG protein [Gammaproteobacteria bacterium]